MKTAEPLRYKERAFLQHQLQHPHPEHILVKMLIELIFEPRYFGKDSCGCGGGGERSISLILNIRDSMVAGSFASMPDNSVLCEETVGEVNFGGE